MHVPTLCDWFTPAPTLLLVKTSRYISKVRVSSVPEWVCTCTVFTCKSWPAQPKVVSNGNRTEWSPIQSVIIWVINKIGRLRSGSPICLITSMITDRIGWHKVLLPINHNFNIICDIIGYFFKSKHKKFEILCC